MEPLFHTSCIWKQLQAHTKCSQDKNQADVTMLTKDYPLVATLKKYMLQPRRTRINKNLLVLHTSKGSNHLEIPNMCLVVFLWLLLWDSKKPISGHKTVWMQAQSFVLSTCL